MAEQRNKPAERRQRLAELLRSRAHSSQEQLVAGLAAEGFSVTQATVSRDLEQLGAVKERQGYRLAERSAAAGGRLAALVGEWVRSVAVAGHLVVLRTPPGSAHLLGVALDESDLPGVVGNICGDDTIFIALADPAAAQRLASDFDGYRR